MATRTRKNGDGSFRKLPTGKVEFTVSVGFDEFGKHQRKRFYGKTESECRKQYKAYIKEGEKPKSSKTEEYTMMQWLDVWLLTYKEGKVQSSTYKNYLDIAVHIRKSDIGKMKLTEIKPIHVTDFYTSLKEYSGSFLNKTKFLLTSCFECAVDNDFCVKNPAKRAKMIKKVQQPKEAFSEAEAKDIIEFAKTDELFGLIMFIMINTGIRGQEMCALTVGQFDFKNGILTVDRAVKRDGNIGLTKNNKTRYIPLKPEVLAFIETNIDKDYEYVIGNKYYTSTDGLRARYNHFFKRLNKWLADSGKEPIKIKPPHSIRHENVKPATKNIFINFSQPLKSVKPPHYLNILPRIYIHLINQRFHQRPG